MISLPLELPTCPRLNNYGGYTSNMRGSLSYKPSIDKIDAPAMLPILRDVYSFTTTKRDFLPSKCKTGKEPICTSIELSNSGYTHENGPAKVDYPSVERANKEKVNMSYHPTAKITPSGLPPESIMTETRESFSNEILNLDRPRPPIDRLIGEMETGFTRNSQANPTDGRVLDPIYLGQYPSYGRFGPSVTQIDFQPRKILTGKEPNEPFSRQTDLHSGFWQEHGPPPCYLRGTKKNNCRPWEDYETSYRVHYPVRSCNKDYRGFTLTGKALKLQGIDPDINLFDGKGYYLSETMERFSDIPKPRVQLYGQVCPPNTPGIFPKQSICPDRPDCPDPVRSCKCIKDGPPPSKPCDKSCS